MKVLWWVAVNFKNMLVGKELNTDLFIYSKIHRLTLDFNIHPPSSFLCKACWELKITCTFSVYAAKSVHKSYMKVHVRKRIQRALLFPTSLYDCIYVHFLSVSLTLLADHHLEIGCLLPHTLSHTHTHTHTHTAM